MNKKIYIFSLLIVMLSCLSVFAEDSKSKNIRYVKLDTLPLKTKASAVAEKKGTLYYGNEVEIIETKGSWVLVKSASNTKTQGWVPESSLSVKKLKAKQNSGNADAKEIALAGKGMSKSMEDAISSDQIADYSAVDKVETYGVSDSNVISFIKEGKLNLEE